VLTASIDKTARLWEPETGQCKQVLEGHTDEIFCCAFNYDGNTIITGLIRAVEKNQFIKNCTWSLLLGFEFFPPLILGF